MFTSLAARVESEVLPFVEKPMRYVGAELNVVRKDLAAVRLHGVFCFPDIYDIGMSHHGLQILYHIVNREPTWALSRAFHPWHDAEALMRQRNIPLWTLEYCTPVAEAHWVGFSVQYELHATALVNMLDLAGIPVRQAERCYGRWPIVIAGGPCMVNPEPFAEFVDAVAVGDGEEIIVDICRILEKTCTGEYPRRAILEQLASVPGIYVPAFYSAERRGRFIVAGFSGRPFVQCAKVSKLSLDDYPSQPLVPLVDVVHHRLAVEVMRGCSRGCRFCSAGTYYRPVRERSPADIREQIRQGVAATGWSDIGLLSLSTGDYGALGLLLESLQGLRPESHLSFSLPSTRIDALDREQIRRLTAISHTTSHTVAPEAGSQRLRQVINKDFSDEDILKTVTLLLEHNVQTIKLYFMVGLPTENQDDIHAIADLVRRISDMARQASGRCTVHVAISPFSPKPFTAFQWEGMESPEQLRAKGSFIKRSLRECRNVRVSYRDPWVTFMETVIARGDRRVGELVMRAWQRGARLEAWDELLDMDRWRRAAEDIGIRLEDFVEPIELEQPLPWEVVDVGIRRDFLLKERARAYANETTPDCRRGNCSACGVCALVPRKLQEPHPPTTVAGAESMASSPAKSMYGRGPRTRIVSSAPQHRIWRVAYRKGPSARFLGHRDLCNVIVRSLIAAGVPLLYTQGYHPHPRVSFGPPLPLGVCGERELMDIVVDSRGIVSAELVNRYLPPDIRVADAWEVPAKQPSLNETIVAARVRFAPLNGESCNWRDRIENFLLSERVVVSIERKGEERKERDIRPLVYALVTIDQPIGFEALLATEPGRTCSPGHLIAALAPERSVFDFLVTRLVCFRRGVDGSFEEM